MKKITILFLLIFGIFITMAYAQEEEQTPSDLLKEESEEPEAYVFPVIKPTFSVNGGYRYINADGSTRAEEFEYLRNSLVMGGELRAILFPHRLHLDFDVRNEKDYYGDFSYAYKDLFIFRGVNSTLFHNLDNIRLFTFGAQQALRNDRNETYGIKDGMSRLFLRFKTPDFPAHLYLEGNFISKNGEVQQMFYNQSAAWLRTSNKRDIDFLTSIYTIGVNSHLGPVEIDLSHSEKSFDVSSNKVFIDTIGAGGGRTAGDYYHNRISELESSTNSLKLHTSLTGQFVASATLLKTDKENRYNGATADYLFAAGEVTWMPLTELTFIVRYRHKETDIDNPDSVTVKNLTDASLYFYNVRDSISSVSDSVSGTIRYRPARWILLRAEYAYEEVRRDNEKAWIVIPDSTQRNKFSLSGDIRIMSGLKLKAKYTHKDINNPATNTEPDSSDEGNIALSWMPFPSLNTFVSYAIKEEDRKSLRFAEGASLVTAENRKVKNDRLIGMVSYVLLKDVSVTASYAYMHDNVRQDIVYNMFLSPSPTTDSLVPYKTTSRNYAFNVNYSPGVFLNLNGGISHTVSQGAFYPSDPNLTSPVSIASFSRLRIKETSLSASGEYQYKNGFSAGIKYRYTKFDDAMDNRYNDVRDGRAQIILLTLSKKW